MSDVVRFTLRLPVELHEKIQKLADENKRSVAKQIEFMLETTLENDSKEQE